MNEDIICEECDIRFTQKKNLYAHLRRIHNKDPVAPKKIKETCGICEQHFVNKSNFYRHLKEKHEVTVPNEERPRKARIKCPMEDCSESFRNYDYLRNHVSNVHKVEIECEELQFESCLKFRQWKNKIQERSLSSYVLHTSPIVLADGSKKEFYNCHRSYNYTPRGNGLRAPKILGTNKIGTACPSRMEVLIKSNEFVLVKFWSTHVGHSLDADRVFLSKEIRADIADVLKEGATFEQILDEIHDASGLTKEESRRILLLKKKDLHNIARDFCIDHTRVKHDVGENLKDEPQACSTDDEKVDEDLKHVRLFSRRKRNINEVSTFKKRVAVLDHTYMS